MNSLVEAEIRDYLTRKLHYHPYDCGTILERMRTLARVAGYQLDEPFRYAGLGAGPEGRIAAAIVDRALGGGGTEVSDYALRAQIRDWLLRNPRRGRL
jgi:hypothetical protein